MYRALGLIPAPQISNNNKTSFSSETIVKSNKNDIIPWECASSIAAENGQCLNQIHDADHNQDALCPVTSHISKDPILYMYFYHISVKDLELKFNFFTCDRSCKSVTWFYVFLCELASFLFFGGKGILIEKHLCKISL